MPQGHTQLTEFTETEFTETEFTVRIAQLACAQSFLGGAYRSAAASPAHAVGVERFRALLQETAVILSARMQLHTRAVCSLPACMRRRQLHCIIRSAHVHVAHCVCAPGDSARTLCEGNTISHCFPSCFLASRSLVLS